MSKIFITNEILDHGMGSRVLKMINIYSYVELLKSKGLDYEYIHTPLSYEGFGKNFNFNQLSLYYHKPLINPREEYLQICRNWDNILKYNGKTVLEFGEANLTPHVFAGFNGENSDECFDFTRKIRNQIKDEFNIKRRTDLNKKVNIHIRRGDVTLGIHADRYSSDEYYLRVINKLKELYPDYTFTIHTQRRNFNETLFNDINIVYDDELNDYDAWLELINSDVLIISKSAFSYSAGALCDGLVIYPEDDMFHPKLYDWKKINEL